MSGAAFKVLGLADHVRGGKRPLSARSQIRMALRGAVCAAHQARRWRGANRAVTFFESAVRQREVSPRHSPWPRQALCQQARALA
jgi:hypothetical protein